MHFGAKLIQNMWHETNKSEDPCSGVHFLNVLADGSKKVKVNSRHHQAVYLPDPNGPIKVLAVHKDKKHVEAIRIEGKPIIGVQWHPEDCNEDTADDYLMSLIGKHFKK